VQAWMDAMAAADLALSAMRARQSTLSSFCAWLVKRGLLVANPVARMDRPPHRREAPRQVPGTAIMDALIEAARRMRDLAIFLILRYSGMHRESVATLRVRNIDANWGLRNVSVKGGTTRDIPLPAVVTQFLRSYVDRVVTARVATLTHDTPLFWSEWGRRHQGKTQAPMDGKNIWRLCKTYGRMIGYPMLKPHDLRHGDPGSTARSRGGARDARPRASRDDADLRADSPGPASARWSSTKPKRSTRWPVRRRNENSRCVFESRPRPKHAHWRRVFESRQKPASAGGRRGFESRSTACFSRVSWLRV
jgi:Phage integrase family